MESIIDAIKNKNNFYAVYCRVKPAGSNADEYVRWLEEKLSKLSQHDTISRFDSELFVPPFRLGRKQKRAILDAKGKEVIIFPPNS